MMVKSCDSLGQMDEGVVLLSRPEGVKELGCEAPQFVPFVKTARW